MESHDKEADVEFEQELAIPSAVTIQRLLACIESELFTFIDLSGLAFKERLQIEAQAVELEYEVVREDEMKDEPCE